MPWTKLLLGQYLYTDTLDLLIHWSNTNGLKEPYLFYIPWFSSVEYDLL